MQWEGASIPEKPLLWAPLWAVAAQSPWPILQGPPGAGLWDHPTSRSWLVPYRPSHLEGPCGSWCVWLQVRVCCLFGGPSPPALPALRLHPLVCRQAAAGPRDALTSETCLKALFPTHMESQAPEGASCLSSAWAGRRERSEGPGERERASRLRPLLLPHPRAPSCTCASGRRVGRGYHRTDRADDAQGLPVAVSGRIMAAVMGRRWEGGDCRVGAPAAADWRQRLP